MRIRIFSRKFVQFTLLVSGAAFSFGTAAVQAGPSLSLPTYEEYVRLNPDQKQELIRAYIDLLVVYENAIPQKYASNSPAPHFAQLRVRMEKLLAEAIISSAHASGTADCYIAGWPSTRNQKGACVEPGGDYLKYLVQCEAPLKPCNPMLFGLKNGKPACVSIGPKGYPDNLNVTERCDRVTQEGSGYQAAALSKAEYQDFQSQVTSMEKGVASACSTYGDLACGKLQEGLALMKKRLDGLGSAGTGGSDTQLAGNKLEGLEVQLAATYAAKNPASLSVNGKVPPDTATGGTPVSQVEVFQDSEGNQFVGPGCGNTSGKLCQQVLSKRAETPLATAKSPDIQEAIASGNMEIAGAAQLKNQTATGAPVVQNQQQQSNAKEQARVQNVRDDYDYRDEESDSTDPCATSEKIGDEYRCSKTLKTIKIAETSNQVTQAVGSLAIQGAGMHAQSSAISAGTQSAAIEAAASTQKSAGIMQTVAGAANMVMSYLQLNQKAQHKDNAEKFKGASRDKTGSGLDVDQNNVVTAKGSQAKVTNAIIDKYDMNEQIVGQGEVKKQLVGKHVGKVASDARTEQLKVADQAEAGGMMSMITGSAQMLQGYFNLRNAKKYKDAAEKLRQAENVGAGLPSFGAEFDSDPVAPRQAQAISSSNSPQGSALEEDDDYGDDEIAGLGEPFNPGGLGDDLAAPAPPAAQFQENAGAGGGAAGGGGGLGGGGSTSPATDGGEAPGPQYADGANNPSGYASTGALTPGRRGGGGGASGGNLDLSGLLAKFLPQEEDNPAGSGILDFGGRSPAQDQPESLLDRSANIFERIHETYQKKAKRGTIGK